MSKCPKCDKKLSIFNVSQFCPACGVNMRFHNFEENFIREAKYAELSQARLKVMTRNLKYSFSGSRLITAKFIVMLLPLVSLFIPSGNFSITIPFYSSNEVFGLLGIVNTVMNGSLSYILGMCSAEITGAAFSALRNALLCYALVLVCALFCFLFSLLGFISIKHMQKVTAVTAGLGSVASVITLVMIGIFSSKAKEVIIIDGGFGIGLIVSVFMFAAVLAVNILLWKKGIHPVYDEGVTERVELYKKVKAGEINIDDLPQPVVVTEATKKIDEAIAQEEAAFKDKFDKENA